MRAAKPTYPNEDRRRKPRGRLPSGKANPVDVHLGSRIRLRRILLGISQEELGEAVGLTFQQIQKYEYGINRVATGRLWNLARVLHCPIAYFFDEMDKPTASAGPHHVNAATFDVDVHDDAMSKREALMLVRAFYTIKKKLVRQHIIDLASALAAGHDKDERGITTVAPRIHASQDAVKDRN